MPPKCFLASLPALHSLLAPLAFFFFFMFLELVRLFLMVAPLALSLRTMSPSLLLTQPIILRVSGQIPPPL